jgi:hypothetical protein
VGDGTQIASLTPEKPGTGTETPSADPSAGEKATTGLESTASESGRTTSRPTVASQQKVGQGTVTPPKNAQKQNIQRTMRNLQKKVTRSCAIYGTGKVGMRIAVYETGMAKSIRVYGKDSKGLLGKCATQIAKRTRFPKSDVIYDIERTIRIK